MNSESKLTDGVPFRFAGLQLSRGLADPELTTVLCADLRQRWERGERVAVEAYLGLEELQNVNEDVLVGLIYGEFVLREEQGEQPKLDDFVTRFPQYANRLRRLLDLHEVLSVAELQDSVESPLAGGVKQSDIESLHADQTNSKASGPAPRKAAPADEIPPFIGKYRIIQQLGSGGQAVVFRAVHPTLGKDVVIKLGRRAVSLTPADRNRLLAEARILAELDHPNLARVYDVDFQDDRIFLVMEHVKGQTLAQLAQQRRLTAREAVEFTVGILHALSAIHRLGIVHRDIKPGNIILDEDQQPRLIDFGLARLKDAWTDEVEIPGSISGTIAFMPPEQARGDTEQIGPRSDLFAVGAVLYFLLTGQRPFSSIEQAARCDFDKSLLAAADIPRRLRNICLKAMQTDARHRYSNAEEFLAELKTYLAQPLFWRIGLAAAAVLLVGTGLWSLFHRGDSEQPSAPTVATGQSGNAHSPNNVAEVSRQPSLTVRVWGNERYLDLLDRVPLHTGDELEVRCTIPAGLHASMFLWSSEGRLELLRAVAPQDQPQSVRFPESDSASVPLAGPPGTEFVFVCGRRQSPIQSEDVRPWLNMESPWPALPGMSVLRAFNGSVRIDQRDRGFGAPKDRPDPQSLLVARMEKFLNSLRQHCVFCEGIAFAHLPTEVP